MRVKLDENLGVTHQQLLRSHGHQVERVTEEGLSGKDDDVVWQRVCKEKRLFITLDLRFSDRRNYPSGSHAGIILLRPHNRGRAAAFAVLRRLLAEHPLETFTGHLTVADETHTRISAPVGKGKGGH